MIKATLELLKMSTSFMVSIQRWLHLQNNARNHCSLKFMFSKKATKIDKIFTVDLTVTTYCQIDGEDLVHFCGLLRKREL